MAICFPMNAKDRASFEIGLSSKPSPGEIVAKHSQWVEAQVEVCKCRTIQALEQDDKVLVIVEAFVDPHCMPQTVALSVPSLTEGRYCPMIGSMSVARIARKLWCDMSGAGPVSSMRYL